jgi:hypothetical protein
MTADMPMGMPADIGLQAAGLEPGSAVALGIDGAIAQGAVVGARAGAIGWELIAWSPAGPPAAGPPRPRHRAQRREPPGGPRGS